MAMGLQQPILYLITSGATTQSTTPASPEFQSILSLVHSATRAGIALIQLREKKLSARVLYQLAAEAAAITRGSSTQLLVNDRADISRAAGCDGVHLTTRSLETNIVKETFGPAFIVGVSTHSLEEARAARDEGADFAVFGPVFATPSKLPYGPPLGLHQLERAARDLSPFPLLAIGGITHENATQVLRAGASGIAAIRLFSQPGDLEKIVREMKKGQK
jgi:thiamine-phosphate pyrophosphorylase